MWVAGAQLSTNTTMSRALTTAAPELGHIPHLRDGAHRPPAHPLTNHSIPLHTRGIRRRRDSMCWRRGRSVHRRLRAADSSTMTGIRVLAAQDLTEADAVLSAAGVRVAAIAIDPDTPVTPPPLLGGACAVPEVPVAQAVLAALEAGRREVQSAAPLARESLPTAAVARLLARLTASLVWLGQRSKVTTECTLAMYPKPAPTPRQTRGAPSPTMRHRLRVVVARVGSHPPISLVLRASPRRLDSVLAMIK